MRLTVLHADPSPRGLRATDIDVTPGTSAATLRQEVARLTGRAEWASSGRTLTADGVLVDASHPAGLAPLLAGSVLSVGDATRVPDERRVVTCARHIAVTAGPDTGTLLPLVDGRDLVVGPGAELAVRDAGWGSTRLVIRLRRPRRHRRNDPVHGVAPDVQVRATGPATLVRTSRRRRTPRPTSCGRWRHWQLGAELHVGTSVLELRDATIRPVVEPRSSDHGDADDRPRRRPHDRAPLTAMLVSTAGTLVTGVVLATAVHQPLLALTGLTGPLLWWSNRRAGSSAPPEPAARAAGVAPDVAALRVASALGVPDADARVATAWDDGGSLAVVGPRNDALAAARAVVLGELGTRGRCTVVVRGGRTAGWAWLAWARADTPGPEAGHRTLVVVDGPDDTTDVAHWRARTPPSHRLLWVGEDAAGVPSWCQNVLSVTAGGAQLRRAGHPARAVRLAGVRSDVAEAQGRALARVSGLPRRGATTTDHDGLPLTRCPDVVAFGALPGVPPPDPAAVRQVWAVPGSGLRTTLGLGPDAVPVTVDLVRDGPHAVVAGTTGSGKSELLTTLVLGLALRHPPERLAVLLVDFKGGTGLPGLAALPHVVGRLSDLDASGARRVLLGLAAELRRRERVIAEAGVRDLDELPQMVVNAPTGGLPRLLVVIDEFRALADDLPELLPGLGRLAAQGRSLGVHLVLATQRPAGAVPTELRANVSLRVALRVVDGADSVDLVGVPDAARISSGSPGRAVLVRGGGAAQAVQVARADETAARSAVRLAPPATTLLGGPSSPAWTPLAPGAGPRSDLVHEWVLAARSAAVGRPHADVPWLPELPERVHAHEIAPGPGIPVALADLPAEQRRAAVRWDPDRGHLLVLGGPGSGRTTTLVALGLQACAAGRDIHAVGLAADAALELEAGAPGRLGTLVPTTDVVTLARLLEALARARADLPRPVLLVDGLDVVLDRLSTLARGAAAELLRSFWEQSAPPAVLVASAPVSPTSARLLGSFPDRLVLGVTDPTLDSLAGVPPALAGPRTVPGRAVHIGASGAVICQVALPAPVPTEPAAAHRAPIRLSPAPTVARRTSETVRRGPEGRLYLPVGLGADRSGTCDVDVLDSLLVVGPPGSGRTTVLSALGCALAGGGIRAVCLPRPVGRLPVAPDGVFGALGTGSELVVVVDDLEDLERSEPGLVQMLTDRLAAQRRHPDLAPTLRVVASSTTAHAVASYHGLVPVMLRARRLLALDLREPGSLDLLGAPARWLADPNPGPPGRGALRHDGGVVPVQLWGPDDG